MFQLMLQLLGCSNRLLHFIYRYKPNEPIQDKQLHKVFDSLDKGLVVGDGHILQLVVLLVGVEGPVGYVDFEHVCLLAAPDEEV